MKQTLYTAVFGMILMCSLAVANATLKPVAPPTEKEVFNGDPQPLVIHSVKQFLELTPKKYYELTGKKLKLSQKISLKIAQHKVKRAMKKNKDIDLDKYAREVDTNDFNIGGFVLGLLLGIIGVLIAYLIGDSSIIKWAWIGFAVWVGIVLLVLIL